MDNNAPILRAYIARARKGNAGGWLAEFGFPGGEVDFVRDGHYLPEVYAHETLAENAARRVLVESLNARYAFRSKREVSSKMTGDEFAAELAETGIMPGDFAQMWGTKQGRVMDWVTGAAEVPFPLRWVLRLLRKPDAIEEAQTIVAENISYKPEWIERQRQRAENQGGES